LNVQTDLSFFDLIVPCGIQDVEMTSIAKEIELRGDSADPLLDVGSVGNVAAGMFAEVFDLAAVDMTEEQGSQMTQMMHR
jgi:lipoate-protein ligase B